MDGLARLIAAALIGVAALIALPGVALGSPMLPDLVSDPPENPHLETTSEPGGARLLLRFDGYIHNAGPGRAEIFGQNLQGNSLTAVKQRVYDSVSGWVDQPMPDAQLIFETADGHRHFHLKNAARYSLWNFDKTAEIDVAEKVGFCLADSQQVAAGTTQFYPWEASNSCGWSTGGPWDIDWSMGVSPGWRDEYSSDLTYQWVNVSDVQPGTYWLRAEVDPLDLIDETDEVNPGAYAATASTIPGFKASPVTISSPLAHGATSPIDLAASNFGSLPLPRRRFKVTDAPDHGTLNVTTGTWFTPSQVQYTPTAGYSGPDSFEYVARDNASSFPSSPAAATASFSVDEAPPPSVEITNAPAQLFTGAGYDLDATVTNAAPGVSWTASAGTIDSSGQYTAPATVPSGGKVTIRATSTASPSAFDEVEIEIANPPPSPVVTITGAPSELETGESADLSASVENAAPGVSWTASAGTITSGGHYTAPVAVPSGGKVTIRATSTASPGTFDEVEIDIVAPDPPPSVAISGAPASMFTGTSADLTATVSNAAPGVTWTASAGTIDSGGHFTAPASVPAGGKVTIRATSTASPSTFDEVEIDIDVAPPDPTVTISGAPAQLDTGSTAQLSASVSGAGPTVNWTASAGTIDSGGHFTAPASVPAGGKVKIRATSTGEPAAFDEVEIEITEPDPPPVTTVAISGAPGQLETATSVELSAAVTGAVPNVSWSVDGVPGGNDTVGTISGTGVYRAPDSVPSPDTVAIRATSTANGAYDEEQIKIVEHPYQAPAPGGPASRDNTPPAIDPLPPHNDPGHAAAQMPALSRPVVFRQNGRVYVRVTPSRNGRLDVLVFAGKRRFKTCRTRVLAGRALTCRLGGRSSLLKQRMSLTVRLLSGRKVLSSRRARLGAAPPPGAHHHH